MTEESTAVVNDRKGLIPNAIHLSRFSLANAITHLVGLLALRWPITNQMKRENPLSFKIWGRAYEDRDASNSGMNHQMGEMISFPDYRTSVSLKERLG